MLTSSLVVEFSGGPAVCCGVLRWSSVRSAKVELQDFDLKHARGHDDRREISAGRTTGEAGDGDFLRAVAEAVLQLLMETDVEGLIGAGRYERSGERATWRNGYRDRTLDTRLGALQLRIPKLRQGSYFPPFLEARKSSERALIAV